MNWKRTALCLLLTFFVVESAMAWPFFRRRPRRSSSSVASLQSYDDAYLKLPTSSAVYDWEEIAKIDAADSIPIVLDEEINGTIEVKLTCLNHSTKTYTVKAKLKDGRADIRHESIEPGTMYRLGAKINGKERIAGPYFTATSGDSLEARQRRQIIVRYFEQYWRKENGWSYYNYNCAAGYAWAIQPHALDPGYGYTSHHLPSLDEEGMIHGDRCGNASHVWMALAYDEDTGHIWCIDSNFNSTIMVVTRTSAGWSVGHFTEAHFYEEEPAEEQVAAAE